MSDFVDVLSVHFDGWNSRISKALHAELKIPPEVHLTDLKRHPSHLIMIWTLRLCNMRKCNSSRI